MARRTVLERRLWAITLYHSAELPMSAACEVLLRGIIKAGVDKLRDDSRLKSEVHVRIAEVTLGRFVSLMTEAALEAGATELQETFFDKIKELLCPVYPFC